jgi:hypothetical protein
MQKARGQAFPLRGIALPLLVGTWFQVLFTPLTGVLFTNFAHATGSLSVAREYLALDGGPPEFRPASTALALLGRCHRKGRVLSPTGLSPAVAELSRTIRLEPTFVTFALPHKGRTDIPTTPNTQRLWPYTYSVWALSRSLAATEEVASLSFPAGTEMFQFPALAPIPYVFRYR